MALADADLQPADVEYVNAHGTSTPAGDAAETRVLKLVFGDTLPTKPAISSTKGATGHTLGAAGAVEAIFTVLALHHGLLPPTINQIVPDPDCDLDYIPRTCRRLDIEHAVANCIAFGSKNSALVLRRI